MVYIIFFSILIASNDIDVPNEIEEINPWGGYSVATSDNLDAFTFNPAGFGVDHGNQMGFYLGADSNGYLTNSSPFYFSSKMYGFGYSFKWDKEDKLFNATDVNISFGSRINRKLSFGSSWSKEKEDIKIGLFFRPINFLSFGLVSSFNENLNKMNSNRFGMAVRPFSTDKLTLGIDLFNENEATSYLPFLELSLGGGISLRSQFFIETFENIKLSDISSSLTFEINFGKSGFYLTKPNLNETDNIYKNWGIGYQETSHKKATIFNSPKKNQQRYIRFTLDGLYIEEKPGIKPFSFNPFSFSANPVKGKQLRFFLDEINKFSNDTSVSGLIIDLGNVRSGFAKKEEIYNALTSFKESGKKIIVYAKNGISNTDYYLISMADEIYINELTGIDLRGLTMEVTFFRELLDTLNIIPEVFRVNINGDSYKTYGDPFLERTATDQMKENYGELLDDLYKVYISGISKGKSWSEDKTKEIVDSGPYYIDSEIVEKKLITGVMYPDQFDEYIKELTTNDKNKDNINYKTVKWEEIDRSDEYIVEWLPKKKHNIALIYAVGNIISGESKMTPSGSTTMGDQTIKKAIKSAREDNNIDAIVLRIDSGGGSALASDQMWREIDLTTNNSDSLKNKPFIASMSDVAASGGYYIACQADKIIASESTITGSIGVIGLSLNTSKFWKQFGINREVVVKNGEHSDFYTNTRLRSDYEIKKIEDSINDIYSTFKQRVIDGRDELDDIDELDNIAMGRVWGGAKAEAHLLIDQRGGINDAILIAAKDAGIEDLENINVIEYPKRDISSKIRNFSGMNKNLLSDILPDHLKTQYDDFKTIISTSEDGAIMILPYSIEIK